MKDHWPEYLIEALGLGAFMVAACLLDALLEHPLSSVHALVPDPTVRRALMGLGMGATAVLLIYSPPGKRSGAHFNPAVTLTFFGLGKVSGRDAIGYVVAQLVGGTLGVAAAAVTFGAWVSHPSVGYVVTVPGGHGVGVAFAAEALISFVLMSVVLATSSRPTLSPFTGLFAGILVFAFILLEAPFSGMSMNPARTLASAFVARRFDAVWVYLVAPPLGMAAAAVLSRLVSRAEACAKLHHDNPTRCIFCGAAAKE